MRMKKSKSAFSDKTFDITRGAFLLIVFIATLYPVIVIVSSSFSSAEALLSGRVKLLPVDFTLDGYKAVFQNKTIWNGIGNSVFYTLVGSAVNLVVTILAAYPLSRNDFKPKTVISLMFAFTMWFGGGMIPEYLLVRGLGLLNTRLALIIPSAMSVWYMVIIRTYFQTNVGGELLEAAKIDGCDDFRYLLQIAIPLSKPVIAVVALYYIVGNWNVFTQAYLYIQDPNKFPIQVVLRDILLLSQTQDLASDVVSTTDSRMLSMLLKYSVIVIASLPMFVIYPFVQKYFVKGIMVGSVKG